MDFITPQIPKGIQVLRLFDKDIAQNSPPLDSEKWIDITKSSPNPKTLSWVKINDKDICKAFYYYISMFNKNFWIHRYNDEFLNNITHWSPIDD